MARAIERLTFQDRSAVGNQRKDYKVTEDDQMVLFHWNILEVSDDLAIFVGMREKAGSSSPYVFRHSTAIESFDESTGVGVTESGRVYRCEGSPSDPNGEIRVLVQQLMKGRGYRFRYPFSSTQA